MAQLSTFRPPPIRTTIYYIKGLLHTQLERTGVPYTAHTQEVLDSALLMVQELVQAVYGKHKHACIHADHSCASLILVVGGDTYGNFEGDNCEIGELRLDGRRG